MGERHNMILGHEGCAEVVEVGSEVRDFKPGDRVLVPAITPNWSSLEAQAGYAMHSGGMLAGWKFSNIKDGVFSEFFHVNDADGNLALMPEGMDIVDACMLSDMVPTGLHGAELADVQFGDTVLVIGIGPVGLMSVAGANLRGASRIIAVGTRPKCVEVAKLYGASDFISYKNGSIEKQALELTGGKGVDKVIIAGGIELMSTIPMGGNIVAPNPDLIQSQPDAYTAMGITAENVAEQYGVTRRMQDEFSMESHRRANAARTEGKFAQEIIPVEAVTTYVDETGHTRMGLRTVAEDEGIRPQTTMESLGKLHTVFKLGGTVTPGNSSQTSDGAAFVILMSGEKAAELGVRPIAKFISFAVAGVPSELMGIGPIAAIPKALKIAGLRQEDMDIIELNEAFAAQSLACINTLGLDQKKVNVNGGAIAMGHPLGCTGSLLTVKVIRELQRRDGRYGMVSMCIGGGMGAAGVFERLP